MPATAEVLAPAAPVKSPTSSEVRRFDLPDLDRHAKWFMPRFLKSYPHLSERQAIGFLRSVLYDNEFLFLFQENGVALAQAMTAHALDASAVVWERFVWVQDPQDPEQCEAAAVFYKNIAAWAGRKSIKIMNVEENTDVPHELIVKQLGRVFSAEQKFAKV